MQAINFCSFIFLVNVIFKIYILWIILVNVEATDMQVGCLDVKKCLYTMKPITYGQSGKYLVLLKVVWKVKILELFHSNKIILRFYFMILASKYVDIKKSEPIYQIFDVNYLKKKSTFFLHSNNLKSITPVAHFLQLALGMIISVQKFISNWVINILLPKVSKNGIQLICLPSGSYWLN